MIKKLIITALISLTIPTFAAADGFYSAPSNTPEEFWGTKESTLRTSTMPLFKRSRLTLAAFLRNREANKLAKKRQEPIDPIHEVSFTFPAASSSNTQVVELGVSEQVGKTSMKLDAKTLDYNEDSGNLTATGSPILNFVDQGVTLKADIITYNTSSNILSANDNVNVIKDGVVIFSDEMQVNQNDETSFMKNIRLRHGDMEIVADHAVSDEAKITLYDGKLSTNSTRVLKMQTAFFNGLPERQDFDADESNFEDKGKTYTIKSKDIKVDARKNSNIIRIKNTALYQGERKLFNLPPMKVHAGKEGEYFEANNIEFGSRRNLGAFVGPGFLFDLPNSAALKIIPLVSNYSGFGIGAATKYHSANNYTEFAYATSVSKMILTGRQRLDDKFFLQYGANSFGDDWFMGRNMSKYAAELVFEDKTTIKTSKDDSRNLTFQHRGSFGFAQDGDINRRFENLSTSGVTTTRARYMAQISQPLFEYKNTDKKFYMKTGLTAQSSSTLYGTGDTQIVGRIGPTIKTQYRNWAQDLAYFQSAYHDETPMPLYDRYRFGHANIRLQEIFWINKNLMFAWRGSMNMSSDSVTSNPIRECGFYVGFGPEEMRFSIGYDLVRDQTYFDMSMALSTKDSGLEFDKMEIKNADRLTSQNNDEIPVWEDNVKQVKYKMQHAEVTEIEDPQKEQI